METLIKDFRYGLRHLRHRAGMTAVAMVVLGLGISLTASQFAIIQGVAMSGPDYERLDDIVFLETTIPQSQFNQPVRLHDYLDWAEQQSVFDVMSAHYTLSANLSGEEGPAERYFGVRMTASVFDMVGTQPILGRAFGAEDDFRPDPDVAIIGYHVWEQRFDRDPDIVGRTIRINARPMTVIGVMPEDFRFPEVHDIWMPLGQDRGAIGRREGPGLEVLGRLHQGQVIETARTQLRAIAGRLEETYPEDNRDIVPVLETWIEAEFVDQETRALLYTMFAAVIGVLLIACANVANLLLASTISRGKELAVRTALGAARTRILRQLLGETLLLAFGGAALGLGLTHVSLRVFTRVLTPLTPPPWMVFEVDAAVLLFVVGITFVTALVAGLLPAFHATRLNLQSVLQDQARGSSSRSIGRWATALVVMEVALSCALLVGAGLTTRSTINVGSSDYGVNRAGLFTAQLVLPSATYADTASREQFIERFRRESQAIPGTALTAVTSALPILGTSFRFYGVRDREYANDGEYAFAGYTAVSPEFFEILDVPVTTGRGFLPSDIATSPPVAVVDQRFVDRNWPGEDPIGKQIRLGRSQSENPWVTVVGVVRTLRMAQPLSFGAGTPEGMFVPITQADQGSFFVMMRTVGDPSTMGGTVQDLVRRMDPDIPVINAGTLDQRVAEQTVQFAIIGGMFTVFGIVALVLASIGLYAVMSFSVSRRTSEVGIRMALGANAQSIVRLVMRQGALPVTFGMVIGLGLAFLLGRALSSFLFGVSSVDPLTYVGIPGLLAIVSAVALLVPANRAAQVTPVVALRAE